ncbi:hypothetical protein KSF73_11945 [Burkholderiaceae bacterium DAT-1]|nr:hypothetical protein [Burkholderiaceae bacterium DAT-1]
MGLTQQTVDQSYGGGKPGNRTGWLCGDVRQPFNPVPVVIQVTTANAPVPPSGMKLACFTDANSTALSNACPVVSFDGVQYWPFSYMDNRMSIGLVGYRNGQVVKQLELTGARYAWAISVDAGAESVRISGQANLSASTSWTSIN